MTKTTVTCEDESAFWKNMVCVARKAT